MKDRRKAGDRRSFRLTPAFPFTDTNGCFLRESRSRMPDRRLNNLSARWISMALVHAHLNSAPAQGADGEVVESVPRSGSTQGKTA